MDKDFAGKNAYITGGSSGIGLSAAKQLAARGANVLIFGRTQERLEAALAGIKECRILDEQWIASMQTDVGNYQNVRQVMAEAVSGYGPPDILINCAGMAYPHYFEEIGYAQFDETMKTNLYGIWNTISALVPVMKEKGGHIVNIASIAGFIGIFGYTAYSASKFGVIGFSEALRSELRKHGLKVVVLCPPDTDTPGFAAENRTKTPGDKGGFQGGRVDVP